jgi:cellulose synthase/poly-beta-1,6-N-acetylglucosamine synthase-like glycosyltransferase
VEILRREFHFVRTEIEYNDHLGTAPIRAFYVSRASLPPGVRRMILIDKENGGKADALNAAINVSRGDFVTSMDADSLLEPDALLRAVRPISDDPQGVAAVGAQVGLSNGCRIENGRVVEVGLPRSWVARFQVVEYMRSFAQGRVAMASLDSLLVLSGVFALMRRDLVLSIGGFLTKFMRSRVGLEYCGAGKHTVCEDMEIIVRLHRYLLDKGIRGRVAILPFPIAWTEAPENYHDLGKQRGRWYRGLLEVLQHHRAMLFRRRFKQIGLFAMPYQLIFEALAPVLETLGYVLLSASVLLGTLSLTATLLFLAFATAVNVCLSTLSVLLCLYSAKVSRSRSESVALFPYHRLRDLAALLLLGLLSNFGYRQMLIAAQVRGLRDFVAGRKEWDKFERRGFAVEVKGA